ncbi:MAG TPA: polysaccharide export protein, partial [Bacteroidetes bacterium]|nr:polysaccharide export protein [Bacteroidota bacterium]
MYKIAYMNCVVTFCVSILLILGIFWLGTSLPVWAQEYIIGADDVLNVTFWQQPDLNSTVKVGQDGKIELPVIGSIQAAGLTPSQLSRRIAERISLFNTKITQASVVVVQYGSKKIYVTGHVLNPGKYTFESIPNLWELILEAGGPAETAILSNIKIIRGGAEGKKSIVVDLTKFLEKGNISELPKLYPGDTVYIPGVTGAVAGAAGGSPLA